MLSSSLHNLSFLSLVDCVWSRIKGILAKQPKPFPCTSLNTAFLFPCSDYPFTFLFLTRFFPSSDFLYHSHPPPPPLYFAFLSVYSSALASLLYNTHKHQHREYEDYGPLFKEDEVNSSYVSQYIKNRCMKNVYLDGDRCMIPRTLTRAPSSRMCSFQSQCYLFFHLSEHITAYF